jgi:hypothetical protein
LAGNLYVQVNSVKQWPTDLSHVSVNLIGRASAHRTFLSALLDLTRIPAWARIHGCYELKPRRKFCAHCCPRDGDTARLKGFAQCF